MSKITRRKFLAGSAAGGAALMLTPAQKALAAGSFEGFPEGMGVLVDLTRCVGCRTCEAACNVEQKLPEPAKPFDDTSVFDEILHGQKRRTRCGARQDRAQHPRCKLHRLLLLEDLRQGRYRHLGNTTDRLSTHALGLAESRTARLCPRCKLFLVPVQRQPHQVPDDASSSDRALACGTRCNSGPCRCLGKYC